MDVEEAKAAENELKNSSCPPEHVVTATSCSQSKLLKVQGTDLKVHQNPLCMFY